MRKRLKTMLCLLTAVAMMFGFTSLPQPAAAAEVDEDGLALYQQTELKTDGQPATLPFSWEKGAKAVFKFTVDTASEITVSMGTSGTAWSSPDYVAVVGGVYYDAAGVKPVYSCDKTDVAETQSVTKTVPVEPGTFYIIFARGGVVTPATGTVSASVSINKALGADRPTTVENAIQAKQGVKYEDLATVDGTRSLFYQVKLAKRSKVQIFTSLVCLDQEATREPYRVEILNSNEVEKYSKSYATNRTVDETSTVLDKGTYYIKVNFKNTLYVGDTSFKVQISAVPNQPKVTALKAGAKKITGTAEKGSRVYAKIGKKTYSAKANASGKYTIKVPTLKKGASVKLYAKNANGNSATKTVKVK